MYPGGLDPQTINQLVSATAFAKMHEVVVIPLDVMWIELSCHMPLRFLSWLSKCPVIIMNIFVCENIKSICNVRISHHYFCLGDCGDFGTPSQLHFCICLLLIGWCRGQKGNQRVQLRGPPNLLIHRCWMLRILQPQPHQDRLMIGDLLPPLEYFKSKMSLSWIYFNDHHFEPRRLLLL